MSFHIKHRPKNLDEFFGNYGLVDSLKDYIKTNSIPHVILFESTYGCGKTTISKLLCEKLNGNLIEINFSDTRGIDNVREIINQCKFIPIIKNKPVVYLIDELQGAPKITQEALLKILEDTPEYVYFFICSTDSKKLIPALLNRCVRYKVSKLREEDLKKLVKNICKKESLDIPDEIVDIIIFGSDGIPRSALILLDQLKNITDIEQAERIAFNSIQKEEQEIIEFCRSLAKKQFQSWADLIKAYNSLSVREPEAIRKVIVGYFTKCMIRCKTEKEAGFFYKHLKIFINPFYEDAEAQLILAFYEGTLK